MWIAILGATGTGKNFVAEHLMKQGFELYGYPVHGESKTPLLNELRYSAAKLRAQLNAVADKERKNIITVGTFWDAHEVFVKTARELELISATDKEALDLVYSAYQDKFALAPPHAVIWCRNDKMDAYNRMKLRSVEVHQDVYNLQLKLFEEFAQKIRVPIIEADGGVKPEETQQMIDFGISSLKAAALNSSSIWRKSFFYE